MASLLLSACNAGPNYQRPSADQPATWQGSIANASAWPSLTWWQGFSSSELNRLVAAAQASNNDVAAAVARMHEADAQARETGASLLPSVVLNPQEETTKQNAGREENYTAHQLSGQVSYDFDFWGKNRSSYEAARETAVGRRFDREVVALDVVSSVATTYFQLLSLQDRLGIAQQNLADAQRVLDGLRLEFRQGTVNNVDVVQQQTVVANLTAVVPPLQQHMTETLDALGILIGRAPENAPINPENLDAISVPPVTPGLPSGLLARRPDVREAEAQLIAANYDVKNAHAQFLPDFQLTAEGGAESVSLAKLFTPEGLMYDVVLSATQPVFEGGRLTAQLDERQSRYQELTADYRKAVISAFRDVEDGLAGTQRTAEAEAASRTAVANARDAFGMAQTQFRLGTVNVLTLLSTETTLFSAEDAYAQARLTRLQATVSLFKALGGGWSDQAAPPTPDVEPEPGAGVLAPRSAS